MPKEHSKLFDSLVNLLKTDDNDYTSMILFDRFEYHGVSEYRSIRYEIRNCLIFGFNQAAISLTNLYLEKFLKITLIDSERTTDMADLAKHGNEMTILVAKYGKNTLEQNINAAGSKGLINKEEKQQLIAFKKTFRNPFSHYDIEDIYGQADMQLQSHKIDYEKGIHQSILDSLVDYMAPKTTVNVANFIAIQDSWLENFAKNVALAYFVWIDNLVCRTELKKYQNLRVTKLIKRLILMTFFQFSKNDKPFEYPFRSSIWRPAVDWSDLQ